MKRALLPLAFFLTSILAIPLVATAGSAGVKGTIDMFGKTYCFPWAPAHAECDWRAGQQMPSETAASHEGFVVPLFGTNVCMGEVADGTRCDVKLDGPGEQNKAT